MDGLCLQNRLLCLLNELSSLATLSFLAPVFDHPREIHYTRIYPYTRPLFCPH